MFLLGIEEGLSFVNRTKGVEAIFIDKEKGVHVSDGLQSNFQLTDDTYHIVK